MKKRLDAFLVENGFYDSRAKAAQAVALGMVKVNANAATKVSTKVDDNDSIVVEPFQYVSRAAQKLLHALKEFDIDVSGKTVMDVGASTGGFTQVLLEHGAKEVYAIDTGENQLHHKLCINPIVHNMQKTNFLNVADELVTKMDIIVSDVSFVSLTKLTSKFAKADCPIVLLIKPQFEC